MDEQNYYEKFFGYLKEDGFYRSHESLWQGKELFSDLKNIFKSKPASEVAELNSFYAVYKRVTEPGKYDSGFLMPFQLLKKQNLPEYLILQKETVLFLDESVMGIKLDIATPGRGSGYIECNLVMKDQKNIPLPLFSKAVSNAKDDQKNTHAITQIKVLADFLHVPLKLQMFVDA